MKNYVTILLIICLGILQVAKVNAQSCNSPTSTPFNQNNGQDGIMFTITAKRDIVIDSFANNFVTGAIPGVEIYYRYGTATGFQMNAAAWILAGSTGAMVSAGTNIATNIPINVNIPVTKFQTVAIYITSTGGDCSRYTNGTGVCDSLGGSNDLVLHEGYGKDYPFAATFTPREFNGKVYYHCVTNTVYTLAGNLYQCNAYPGQIEQYYINPPVEGKISWQVPSGTLIVGNDTNDTVTLQFVTSSPYGQICANILGCGGGGDVVGTVCANISPQPPSANAGPDQNLCGQSIQLQGNSAAGGWQVVSGAGSFANANLYNTTVSGLAVGQNVLQWTIGGGGCPYSSDQVTITVKPQALANFSSTSVCVGQATQLIDNSYALGGSIVAVAWDVDGNGTNDYSTNVVSHTYPAAGTYNCRLIATATDGCKDTIIKTVTVHPNPSVDFTYTPDCEGSPMAFTDLSTIASGSNTDWLWTFGDGGTSNVQHPSHLYASDGYYVVKLKVTSQFGCSTSNSDSVEVFTIPDVDFNVDNVCRVDTAKFMDISTSIQGAINYWEWDFGDGFPLDNNQNTAHKYANHGAYNVRLLVATDKGCTNQIVKPLHVYPLPEPSFKYKGVCEEQLVTFTDTSVLAPIFNSKITAWDWDFDDGKHAYNGTPGHFFQEPGYYWVKLTPTTNHGCFATDSLEVLIRPRPQANIQVFNDHVCALNKVDFKDETYFDYEFDTNGVVKWYWNFADSGISVAQHPSHIYKEGGEYSALLVVETIYGCVDSVYETVVIYHNPVASFVADTFEGCSPLCVTLIDKSTLKDEEDDMVYQWTFGDSLSGTDVNPTHCYELEDSTELSEFVPRLKVTTAHGCSSEKKLKNPIAVYPNPIADFELSTQLVSMLEPVVEISNFSLGADFWTWDFGDSTILQDVDPINHTYESPGTYVINLETSTSYGCLDKASRVVTVRPHQSIYIPASFTPDGDGINDLFEIKGEDLEYVKLWIFDRWGKELFFGENEGWNGTTADGQMSAIGAYGYMIEYKQTDRIRERLRGTLYIIKSEK